MPPRACAECRSLLHEQNAVVGPRQPPHPRAARSSPPAFATRTVEARFRDRLVGNPVREAIVRSRAPLRRASGGRAIPPARLRRQPGRRMSFAKLIPAAIGLCPEESRWRGCDRAAGARRRISTPSRDAIAKIGVEAELAAVLFRPAERARRRASGHLPLRRLDRGRACRRSAGRRSWFRYPHALDHDQTANARVLARPAAPGSHRAARVHARACWPRELAALAGDPAQLRRAWRGRAERPVRRRRRTAGRSGRGRCEGQRYALRPSLWRNRHLSSRPRGDAR